MRLLSALLVLVALIAVVHGAGKVVMGYYPVYDQGYAAHMGLEKMSHVVLGGINIDDNGNVVEPSSYGESWGWTLNQCKSFFTTTITAAHAKGTKAILMLGGQGANTCDGGPPEVPGNFNKATTAAKVDTTAQNLVDFATGLGFDGIDLDWEECLHYDALQRLATSIRSKWPAGYISFPVGVLEYSVYLDPLKNYPNLVAALDAINMMSYIAIDNWGGWDPWHVAPLSGYAARHPYSIQFAYDRMIAANVPAAKIGIGMSFYGSCWGYPITQPVQDMGNNTLKASDGDMSYRNIANLYKPYMVEHNDTTAQVPYLNHPTGKGPRNCSYISYDTEWSIKAKADFVIANGVSGIIIWTISQGILNDNTNPSLDALNKYFRGNNPSSSTGIVVGTTASTSASATTGSPSSYTVVFEDTLASGWNNDYSYSCEYSTTTTQHYSGSASMQFNPNGAWGAVAFVNMAFIDPALHAGLEFYVNGGSAGGQDIYFDVSKVTPGSGIDRVAGASGQLNTSTTS